MKNKKNTKKAVATTALATGTMVLGALAGATNAQAADLFAFETLGSGAELRSELLAVNNATDFIKNNDLELKCGEGKTEEKKSAKAKEGKAAEGKCGEGKCGEDGKKAAAKSAKAADGKAAEGKCGEGKCGEGKCGEKKVEKKAEKKGE
jgi:uncharacterized low-complexity protein